MYVIGTITGNTIAVEGTSGARLREDLMGRGQVCLLVVKLADIPSADPKYGDVIGVYVDPNGAKLAVAAKK